MDDPPPPQVPVSEAVRFRERAEQAEQRADELSKQLDESQATITALERREKLDAELTRADAVDLEAARLLTEVAVSQMDEPDVELAVRDLRRHRPYLFRQSTGMASSMPAHLDAPAESPSAEAAAAAAATTGHRRDLLTYLRLRRQS